MKRWNNLETIYLDKMIFKRLFDIVAYLLGRVRQNMMYRGV